MRILCEFFISCPSCLPIILFLSAGFLSPRLASPAQPDKNPCKEKYMNPIPLSAGMPAANFNGCFLSISKDDSISHRLFIHGLRCPFQHGFVNANILSYSLYSSITSYSVSIKLPGSQKYTCPGTLLYI